MVELVLIFVLRSEPTLSVKGVERHRPLSLSAKEVHGVRL